MKKQTKPRYIAELSVHAFRCLMLNSCKSMVVNSNYVCKIYRCRHSCDEKLDELIQRTDGPKGK